MVNFNHERFVISAGAGRGARVCYELAFKEAMTRKTFGKRLMQHQVSVQPHTIRWRLVQHPNLSLSLSLSLRIS
jgi:hypothetical protein